MPFGGELQKNCVNTNLIRIPRESQKPEVIYPPDTWSMYLLGLVVLNLAALQDPLVSVDKITLMWPYP